MADVFKIEGFEELNRKIKRLPDAVKRTEILKIQRKLADPAVIAYKAALPKGRKSHSRYTRDGSKTTYPAGNLRESTAAITVSKLKSKGNPSIAVRPQKKGQNDGYYRFMVVKEGFKGSGRGSRIGFNTVVPDARDRALRTISATATREAEVKTAKYIQKQIDRLP